MDKRFIGALIVIVIILGAIFAFTGGNNKTNSSGGSSSQPTNHVEGQNKDSITLVEYGDYQCPFCGEFFSVVKQVEQEYNSQILFQFRNLPLTEIHPNAFAGARAAEAAGLQGKFWQMHDLLYEENQIYYSNQSQPSWISASNPETYFVSFAQQLGLNVTQFKKDFAGSKVNNLINADLAQFPIDFKKATGSYDPNKDEATPTFFLDNKQIQPQNMLASFESIINTEIKKKGFTPPTPSSTSTAPATTTAPSQSVQ